MENKLAENIRLCRKNLGLTQEQLAERLGVTLGAVSKWERGSSEPDLGYLMDLAGIFHESVDALIGFSMHGLDADEEEERIEQLVNRIPFEDVAEEYEKALKRFPNHFGIVLGAAAICKRIGSMEKKSKYVERSLALYRHAIELISQNKDPQINEVLLRNEIAGCYSELKNYKKAIEEYKKNNSTGSNAANIALLLIQQEKNLQEGVQYLLQAFLNNIADSTYILSGFFHYYVNTKDTENGIRAVQWELNNLLSLKKDPEKRCYLDKIICMAYTDLAILTDLSGREAETEENLQTAFRIARKFDADPVYDFENMLFTEKAPENMYFYDDAGPTAAESLKTILEEAGDTVSEAFRKKFEKEYRKGKAAKTE